MFHDWLDECLRQLRRAGIGQFRHLQPESPAFQEIALPLATAQVRSEDAGADPGPYRVLALPESRFVYGIRIAYRDAAPREVRVYWTGTGQDPFTRSRRYFQYSNWGVPSGRPGEWMTTVWVCETVAQVGLQPEDEPGFFEITEVVLLVPPKNGKGPNS
jgi:hypothetical protein